MRTRTIMTAALAIAFATAAAAQGPAERPADSFEGRWVGQYQTKQALHGQLKISVVRSDRGYELEVVSSNEHYPSEEPERLVDFSVEGDRIQWTLFFGPNRVLWTGMLKGDFIVGELSGGGGEHAAFEGYWTAVRLEAAVSPRG